MEGNLRFKIVGAGLIVGSKFTVFALFYFAFEGNFQVQAPWGLIFGGGIQRRVFCVAGLGGLYLEGLIHGGAYPSFQQGPELKIPTVGVNFHWEPSRLRPARIIIAVFIYTLQAILRMCFPLVLRHPYPFFRSFNAPCFVSIERFGG